MNNIKRQLLCTFSSTISVQSTVEEIKKFYNTGENTRFFVFSNVNIPTEVFITYNIILTYDTINFSKFINTISIHRKKEYNVLYSLNAMNQIIKEKNNGILDKTFSVDWSLYTNSLIITGSPSIKIIPIKILEIIE